MNSMVQGKTTQKFLTEVLESFSLDMKDLKNIRRD